MIRKLLCLLCCLLLCAGGALADGAETDYMRAYENGVIFNAYMLEGGDLLHFGSYVPKEKAEYNSDSQVARVTPEGEVIWRFDVPNISELAGSGLLALGGGRYMKSVPDAEGVSTLYFFDEAEGLTREAGPTNAAIFLPLEDGILAAEPLQDDMLWFSWLDDNGEEIRGKRHTFTQATYIMELIEAEDGFYLTYMPSHELERFTLAKFDNEGMLAWENTYHAPGNSPIPYPDGQGNIMLVCDLGDGQTMVRCVGSDGEVRWETTLDAVDTNVLLAPRQEEGFRLALETADTLQLVIFDDEGNAALAPALTKPDTGDPDASVFVYGLAEASDGALYTYGFIGNRDGSTADVPVVIPLDAYK